MLAHDTDYPPRRLSHAKIPQLLALGWMREPFTAVNYAAVLTLAEPVLLGSRVSVPPRSVVRPRPEPATVIECVPPTPAIENDRKTPPPAMR